MILKQRRLYETAWSSVLLGGRRWELTLVSLDLGRLAFAFTRDGSAKKGEVGQLLARIVEKDLLFDS